jgi:hypothetical protein
MKCHDEGNFEEGDKEELVELLVPSWVGPATQKKFRPESVRPIHSEVDRAAINRCVDVLYFRSPSGKRPLSRGSSVGRRP